MPLLNSTIIRLNEITTLVEDKTHLTSENESLLLNNEIQLVKRLLLPLPFV